MPMKSDGKSNHSRSVPMNEDLTSKNFGVVNAPLRKFDKASTLSPKSSPNGALRPMTRVRQSKMKQSLANNSNCKPTYSRANHLKAMPGLIRNMKDQSNLDEGATKRKHSEIGLAQCIGGTSDQNLRCEPLPELEVPDDTSKDDWCIGGTIDKNLRCEPLPEPEISDDIDLNMPKTKRRRKYIETDETDDDVDDIGHQSIEGDSTRLHHHATMKDCHANVSPSHVSKSVVQQHDCWSKPIDESTWSGLFKVGSKEFVSLSGHLSTKSCEKVWNLCKSLRRIVEVTKVCRSEVWPKRWEASRPASDNFGLYFFPYKMRSDNYLDQLLMEVMDNDLALRAVIDEAEILIFPSSLLPEQYQTFQSKHYLWAVFRPRVFEGKHAGESRQEDNSAEAAIAAVATDATTSVPTVAGDAVTKPTEVLMANAYTRSANHVQIDSSMESEPGRVVSFVVRQTPRIEQLIQEMKRKGALIVAMQGEMIADDGSLLDCRQHDDGNIGSKGFNGISIHR